MHGHEQIRPLLLRQPHPIFQRDKHIARPAQRHPVAAGCQQLPLQFLRGGKGDMLLIRAGNADGAGVFAAMPGVQQHQRQLAARRFRGRRGFGGQGRRCKRTAKRRAQQGAALQQKPGARIAVHA